MKVLFLTTHLNTGGITSYLYTLAKGLIQRGHSVHIGSSAGNMQAAFEKIGAKIIILNIRTKSEMSPKIYFSLGALKSYIKANSIDIIHAHTRVTQVMGHFSTQALGIPLVTTCHGFFKPRLFRKIFPCWGERVIAISAAVQKHLQEDFHVPQEKIAQVSNGIDLKSFPLIDEKQRQAGKQKFGLSTEPTVGIIARLSQVKGQDVLIAAMREVIKKIPQAQLFIIGEGKTEESLKKLTKDYQLEKSVHFLSMLNQTRDGLMLLDVFAMPSRQEGLGISVIEAQSCGLAVVASKVGGLPSLIEDGKTGFLVEVENPTQLAQRIIWLLENQQLRQKIGLAAREFVVKNYSSDQMVTQTLDVYQKVLR